MSTDRAPEREAPNNRYARWWSELARVRATATGNERTVLDSIFGELGEQSRKIAAPTERPAAGEPEAREPERVLCGFTCGCVASSECPWGRTPGWATRIGASPAPRDETTERKALAQAAATNPSWPYAKPVNVTSRAPAPDGTR